MKTSPIDRKEQKLMLKTLNNLPDKQTPNNLTTEELEEWYNCKGFYKALQLAFANYFTGNHYFQGISFDESCTSLNKSKRYFDFKFQKYLHLYNTLNFGWEYIRSAFKDVIFPLNTPGEAWMYILSEEVKYIHLNPVEKTPPKKLYRMWLTYKKLKENEPVSEEKVNLFEQFIQNVKRKNNNQLPKYIVYLELFLDACKSSRNEMVLNELHQYETAHREIIALVAKNLQNVSP